MGHVTAEIIERYVREVSGIYGSHLRKIILYGSYARGAFREDSDVDIMILGDLDDSEIKAFGRTLSGALDGSMAVGKDEIPGPNPGSSFKSPHDRLIMRGFLFYSQHHVLHPEKYGTIWNNSPPFRRDHSFVRRSCVI